MKRILSLIFALCVCISISAKNNVITYTASAKLTETTASTTPGLHTNAFNVAIQSHEFSDSIGTITFAGDVTSIGNYAFYKCNKMTSIVLPNSVTTFGVNSFAICDKLTSFKLPTNIQTIESGAFNSCESIQEFEIDVDNSNYSCVDGVLFNKTKNVLIQYPLGKLVEEYVVPDYVNTIGPSAFCCAVYLSNISIPNGVSIIGNDAFFGCKRLRSVVFPNCITKLGNGVCSACDSLQFVVLPSSVQSLGSVFMNSGAINNITCQATLPPTCNANCFFSVDKSIQIYVPQNSVNAYKSADVWKDFTNIQAIATPSAADLTKYNPARNIVLCVNFEQGVCNDVLVMGGYNDWTYDTITTIKMEILEGFEGWYVAAIPFDSIDVSTNAFKPVHLQQDGSFNWDYAAGGVDSWIKEETDGATLTIVAGLGDDEANLSCSAPGAYIYKNTRWRNNSNPCKELKNYKITLYPPYCPLLVPTIAGGFTNWNDAEMDAKLGIKKNRFFTYEIKNQESTCEYRIKGGSGWDNPVEQYDSITGQWSAISNMKLGEDTVITLDWRDENKYRYRTCNEPTESNHITYTATEKLPEVTSTLGNGLHTNAFNVAIQSHEFSDGSGTIIFDGDVTTVGNYAFYSCTGLTSIDFPATISSMGKYIFSNCTSLTKISVDNANTRYAAKGGVLFTYNTDTLIQYPVGNTQSSYEIPTEVTTIGQYAFNSSTSLAQILIPRSVKTIESSAFRNCTNLKVINTEATTPPMCGSSCFYDVDKTIPVYVPSGCIEAYTKATIWEDFTNIQDISDPQNVIRYTATEKLPETTNASASGLHTNAFPVSILSHTFSDGEGTITFAGYVTSIGDRAFYTCNALTSVIIPKSVTSIGKQSFCNCASLTTFAIHSGVTSIGASAWRGCNGMTDFVVDAANTHYASPDGVLYNYALDTLIQYPVSNSRTAYTIVSSVKSIADYAFYYSTSISSLTCAADVPPTCSSNSLYGINKTIPLYVPGTSVSSYRTADVWKDFTNIQPTPGSSFSINYSATNGIVDGPKVAVGQEQVTLTVTANTGYHFSYWSDGDTTNPRILVINKDTTLTAFCEKNSYRIVASVNDPSFGQITGNATALYQDVITLTAVANPHYHFTHWSDGITDNPRQVTITSDSTFTAFFALNQYMVTISADDGGIVSGASSGIYDYGTALQLLATPNERFRFVQWSDGNTEANRTVIVTDDLTLTAVFSDEYQLTVSFQNGSVDGAGMYQYGSYAVLVAWPDYGFEFVRWSDGTEYNPHVLYITENVTLTAIFMPATAIDEVGEDDGVYTIYNANGNLIYHGTDADYSLPGAGLYIIQHNSTINKVIVQ